MVQLMTQFKALTMLADLKPP